MHGNQIGCRYRLDPRAAGRGRQERAGLKARNHQQQSRREARRDYGAPLDPDHPAFAPVLRAQTAAANTALSTQAKVDESALRKHEADRMPELLRLAAEVRAKLPPLQELEKPRVK